MRGLINFLPLFLLLASFILEDSIATDTITITEPIQDPQSIVSSGQNYSLGFFRPVNTSKRYVGITMNIPEQTVIWVANRDRPLKDSDGIVTISEEGNIVVLNGQKETLWSSNVPYPVANSSAQLLDTGNLVLRDNSNGSVLWESFSFPTDYFVKRMKAGVNNKNILTSWKSPSDPSAGSFSLGFDPLQIPEIFVWTNNKTYWRSGPWNGIVFIGLPGMSSAYKNKLYMVNENTGSSYFTYDTSSNSSVTYYVLTSSGTFLEKVWYDGIGNPKVTWSSRQNECDVYGKCGSFGFCNPQGSPICSCLQGFEPRDEKEWKRGNWTGGCLRKAMLQCERNSSVSQEGKQDGFLKLNNIKVPDSYFVVEFEIQVGEPECHDACLNNCSCIAFAFNRGIGCMHWSGSLIDIQQFTFDGSDLYLRVAYSELDYSKSKSKRGKIAVIASIVIVVSFFIVGVAYFFWKWFTRSRGKMSKIKSMFNDNEELHLYSYDTLAFATDNFHSQNMLGKGGFGPVYKGKLINCHEIAVKRFSNSSSQGSEEFMNEVLVISKLQHRNLVRLLGCCVEREEKMLVYEYMPKKSLDAYLFDSGSLEQDFLDWNRRRIIIEGISRGLLYLHRDSRLKIIHRDLKAGNILLDAELNPKISDFGLARIFGGNQDQANTNRVVGTYGYMAPEYAMRGKFSEKSDVYSFGVLLLEILSGRRNISFCNEENDLSLIGHAWKLWHENETAKLIQQSIFDQHNEMEFSRYVQIGLLCVQEYAKDRPNMPAVLSMLNSEIADLPPPKLPAYAGRMLCSKESGSSQQRVQSSNDFTITILVGR